MHVGSPGAQGNAGLGECPVAANLLSDCGLGNDIPSCFADRVAMAL